MRSKHGYYYSQSKDFRQAPPENRVLVALVPTLRDWQTLHEQGWYRIPARSAPQPMEYGCVAFYQAKGWGKQEWAINYWARIAHVSRMPRIELLPQEESHPRAHEIYYRLNLGDLKSLPEPIRSRRRRFIVFISTTLDKFTKAYEINDLFCESPLEETLWERFRQEGIEAERQWYVSVGSLNYCLDFAVFCPKGKIDVECDGDLYHVNREKAPQDNKRNNVLTSAGWEVLRFGTKEITETPECCLEQVRETANLYGGLLTAEGETRWFTSKSGGEQQLNLFGKPEEEE
jgi:very-short-patch-repair endonuclease